MKESSELKSEDGRSRAEKRQFQRALQSNRKLVAKKLVSDALQQNSEDVARQALEAGNALRSRGVKRRLTQKLRKKFVHVMSPQKCELEKKPTAHEPAERGKKYVKCEKVRPKTRVLRKYGAT